MIFNHLPDCMRAYLTAINYTPYSTIYRTLKWLRTGIAPTIKKKGEANNLLIYNDIILDIL